MSVNLSGDTANNKNTFKIVNPSNDKILAFINFSKFVDESTANGLSADEMKNIISKCKVELFVKGSTNSEAFDGLL